MFSLLATALEKLLNKLLQASPSLTPQLRQLSGFKVQLVLTELSNILILVVTDRCLLIKTMLNGQEAHCQLTTQLALLPKLRDPNQLMPLIRSGELVIEGDILRLQQLVTLLGQLEWDVEEQLSRQKGDIAAHAALRPLQWARKLLKQQCRQQQAWIRELLVEVWCWLPSRAEAEAFAQSIAQLQQEQRRLASRLPP